jgi:hypothetical protein
MLDFLLDGLGDLIADMLYSHPSAILAPPATRPVAIIKSVLTAC